MVIAAEQHTGTESVSFADRVAKLRAIDTDVHNDLPSMHELKPYLAREWHAWIDNGGPGFASRAYANTGSGVMDDSVREEDGLAAGDPDWVIQQLLKRFRIDIGVCTGSVIGTGIQHNARFATALIAAYNDWLLHKWIYPYDCFKEIGRASCRERV